MSYSEKARTLLPGWHPSRFDSAVSLVRSSYTRKQATVLCSVCGPPLEVRRQALLPHYISPCSLTRSAACAQAAFVALPLALGSFFALLSSKQVLTWCAQC